MNNNYGRFDLWRDRYPIRNYQFIDFDTTPTVTMQEGRMAWDATDGTVVIGMPGGNVNLNLGQEQLLKVVNSTGADLSNGQLVYINGAQGQRPTISLAKADAHATAAPTIAMLTEDIKKNNNGYATTFGIVRTVNTNAYTAGTELYLSASTAGGYTSTEPSFPNHVVSIGYVLHQGLTDGMIFVNIQINSHPDFTGVTTEFLNGNNQFTKIINKITTTAINYTATTTDDIIVVTAYNKTITIPTAVGITGRSYSIDNKSTGKIFVTSVTAIQGKTTQIVPRDSCMDIYSNGSVWRIK